MKNRISKNMMSVLMPLWVITILDIMFLLGGLLLTRVGFVSTESVLIFLVVIKLCASISAQMTHDLIPNSSEE